jgi:hypothetical protein
LPVGTASAFVGTLFAQPKENQGTVTKAAAEQTGIDGADPVA